MLPSFEERGSESHKGEGKKGSGRGRIDSRGKKL